MNTKRKPITFDWAIKRLLRSKANFGILEASLSELLKEDIIILGVLESESSSIKIKGLTPFLFHQPLITYVQNKPPR
ncbi:MAG: hypothetical protein Q7U57_09965 [Methylovulum sp.]|nr:hypothetical protein [Methylovulum sp.]